MHIEYYEDKDLAVCDGYRFRRDKKTGYYLSSCKIGGKRIRLHVYVWTRINGPVPKGYSVHHIDEDKYNNDISNLALMTSRAHTEHHAIEYAVNNYDKVVENLKNNAMPAAREWHKSADGHEWHKNHYEAMKDKLRQTYDFKCEVCGKEFKSSNTKSRFCSNACKSQYRRDMGYDDIQATCIICGAQFKKNKYSTKKTCSKECQSKLLFYKKNKIPR